jgi:hypothetical protein
MMIAMGNTGTKYPMMKSHGFKGEMNSLVKKEELLSLAMSSPRNMVIKVKPNMVSPGTMFTG